MPFVFRYPGFNTTMQKGSLLRAFSTVADIAPTLLDLAGIEHPVPAGKSTGNWHEREVAAMRGKSWVKYLAEGNDDMEAIHTDDDAAFGWELFGRAGEYIVLVNIIPTLTLFAMLNADAMRIQLSGKANGRSCTWLRPPVAGKMADGSCTTCRRIPGRPSIFQRCIPTSRETCSMIGRRT